MPLTTQEEIIKAATSDEIIVLTNVLELLVIFIERNFILHRANEINGNGVMVLLGQFN